jgi:hypothetical protein
MADKPFRIGDWAQWTLYTGNGEIRCWYDGKIAVACDEPKASRVVHDKRGCFHVCRAHARWRSRASMMAGHHHCPDGK